MKVHYIVQEAAKKTIPKKKKSKKVKWLCEEGLQIAEERREAKSKGERERYIQIKAELQRTARRDKRASFNEQCRKHPWLHGHQGKADHPNPLARSTWTAQVKFTYLRQ